MSRHLDYLIKALDIGIDTNLRQQCLDPANPLYGAHIPPLAQYFGGERGTGAASQLILGYYAKGGSHYRNDLLLERCMLALEFASKMQKSDGTFDLLETNFHDATMTSFILAELAPAALLMRKYNQHTEIEDRLYAQLIELIDRCAWGLINGGFHTPNHRWVMASALSMCYNLTGRQDCLDKMNLLLNEGIDIDSEGEFTERSTGTYNIVCDRSLIFLAETAGMSELYGLVERNLKLVIKYIEPDFSINTLNSTRQDAGTQPDWRIYYGHYLYMALRTGNRQFRYIADAMLNQSLSGLSDTALASGSGGFVLYSHYLAFMLMDEALQADWDINDTEKPDFNYNKLYENSGIVRYRRNKFSLTIVKNNPNFAQLKLGTHNAYLRLCGTFYAQGQFEAESITEHEGMYTLTYHRRWGYKSPLPERQATSDWRKMDHSKRRDVMMQDFDFIVTVKPVENGAEIRVQTNGVESVLTKFEILLDAGHAFISDSGYMRTRAGDYIIQSAQNTCYTYDDGAKLCISGGIMKHTYAQRMRGSVPADSSKFTVAMTADTPMDNTFTLKFA